MTDAPATTRRTWRRATLVRALAGLAAMGLLLLVILIVANSRLPRRAAGIYGGLFERIQRRPAVTAAICLGGVALLWAGIGVLAATDRRLEGRKPQ